MPDGPGEVQAARVVRNGEGGTKRGWNLATRDQARCDVHPVLLRRSGDGHGSRRNPTRAPARGGGTRDRGCRPTAPRSGPHAARTPRAAHCPSGDGAEPAVRTPVWIGRLRGHPARHGSATVVPAALRHSGRPHADGRGPRQRSELHGNRSVGCRAVAGSMARDANASGWYAFGRRAGQPQRMAMRTPDRPGPGK